jgi:hypothetical protein
MKLTVSEFKHVKKTLLDYINKNSDKNIEDNIAMVSSFTGVPLVALYHIVIKYHSNTENLKTSLNNIIKFYGYTQIDGIDDL